VVQRNLGSTSMPQSNLGSHASKPTTREVRDTKAPQPLSALSSRCPFPQDHRASVSESRRRVSARHTNGRAVVWCISADTRGSMIINEGSMIIVRGCTDNLLKLLQEDICRPQHGRVHLVMQHPSYLHQLRIRCPVCLQLLVCVCVC